jgi:predicted membrane-bound dolichyl-phosphate-mannose-protein mannosyltransferase
LFPHSGFATDLASYASWAETLWTHGPGGFYAHAGFADYPPGYLYLLWPIGYLIHLFPDFQAEDIIKVGPILLDLAVGFVLYRLVRSWSGSGARGDRLALAAGALYLFNPVTWYDSALWGQTDAAGALVMLLGVAALIRGNSEGAAAMAVVAAMVKPQFGVVMIPLVAVVLLKRHLFDPGSGPRHRPLLPGRIGQWLRERQGPVRLATTFVVAWAVFFAMALPFGMGPVEYIVFLARTAGGYPYVTVNAYNPWALVGVGGHPALASSDFWIGDTVPFLGPISPVVIGTFLLLTGFVLTLFAVYRRPDRTGILIGAVVLSAAFFVLPTRVHERYLFPVFAFLPLLAVWNRKWRWALVAFSIGSFMNLHAILTQDNPVYGTPNVANLPFGDLFRTFPFVALSVVLQTGAFAFAVWQLRPSARREAVEDPGDAALALADADRRLAPDGGLSGAPGSAVLAANAVDEAGDGRAGIVPWERGPGIGAWIDGALGTLRPVRRDRSGELAGEGPGRLDRLDLLVLVVVVIGSFGLRGFHLEQPYDMYFDEVYHARTGTEFLQDWRYGLPHSIYEYTHPHLAKYAMALGIVAFGDNAVTGTAKLPQTVTDAAVEPRWSPGSAPSQRNGDRLYVADPSGIGVYDLASRERITQIALDAPPTAIAVDDGAHRLYVALPGGAISALDTAALDELRATPGATAPAAEPFALITGATGNVQQLVLVDGQLVARTTDSWLASFDTADGTQTGVVAVDGARDVERLPGAEQVIADPTAVTDPKAEAAVLAKDLNENEARVLALLRGSGDRVSIAAYPDKTDKDELQKSIAAGDLDGIQLQSGPVLAVSDDNGISIFDAVGLESLDSLAVPDPNGMALVERGLEVPTLYVAGAESNLQAIAIREGGPSLGAKLLMPGPVSDVVWNEPANLVHVLGSAPDGAPTIYVVEPHADPGAVFADARLPFEPARLVVDTQPDRPQSDRLEILALAPDGTVATVDIGRNAFAWRLPGVLMGSLTAACVYLLARILFRRRSVGLIAAVLVMAGGMFFANARIAMNDTYVTGFLLAAATLFAPLYLGMWRRRWQIIAGLVGVGLLLGLALASKWVALYAMGGLVLLVLLRSALGRIVALAGMIAMTAALGALAVRGPAADQPHLDNPHINVFFLLLMLVLTAALAVAMVRRPIRMTLDEMRFAVVAPAVLGVLLVGAGVFLAASLPKEGLFAPSRVMQAGAACLLLGAAAYAVAWLAGRFGRGPLAEPPAVPRDEPVPSAAPTGWLRPGWAAGIPWLFALACLFILPIAVYVASYAPWVALGNHWLPAPGQSGSDLIKLQLDMYNYHNTLRAGHAASSPWWAWLFDLKPVWFYQHGFADGTTGVIYDSENLVLVWLAIPAIAFAAWAAWHRRSLALAFVVLMFAVMLLPWSRIDRATFQYHVFTSLPFAVLALAYFLAELWHGPPRGAWLVARIAAAVAIIGPPLLWLGRQPLCLLSGSTAAHTAEGGGDGIACGAITRSTDVSEAALASALVLVIGLAVLGWQLWLLYRAGGSSAGPLRIGRFAIPSEAAPFATLVVILVAVVAAVRVFSPEPAFTLTIGADEIALVGLAALAVPAWLVLHARDSRRFVLGVLTAVVLWFVAWYPNLSGLPLPNSIANIYQGLLPSWNYDFWFAVNKDELAESSILGPTVAILAITLLLVVAVVVLTHWLRPEKPAAGSDAELPESI